MLPMVAIVGAPNVGKSTLFNRLVRRRRSIVTDQPGVTRDRIYGDVRGGAHPFRVVDTGGLAPSPESPLAREIERQVATALDESDLVLFVVDGRAVPNALDVELAARLRRRGRPIVLVANKLDAERTAWSAPELYRLGLGEPIGVSAEHGIGVGELLERIDELLQALERTAPRADAEDTAGVVSVAIVGRPNVGKSSLLNRLVGAERAVVSEVPGTTRDSVDTLLRIGARRYRLIDTAGLRRRGKASEDAERLAATHARRSIAGCDVAVLVLDGTAEFAAQDAHVAGEVAAAHKPLLVAANKWDAVPPDATAARSWEERVRERLRFVAGAPIVRVSAKSGLRVRQLLVHADRLHAMAGRWVPTPELNRWFEGLRETPGGSSVARGGFKLFYGTQSGIRPPTFIVFCNDASRAHLQIRRHLANGLRERFGLGPVPVRLQFRSRRGNA